MGLILAFSLMLFAGAMAATLALLIGFVFVLSRKNQSKHAGLKLACLSAGLLVSVAVAVGACMLMVSVINF